VAGYACVIWPNSLRRSFAFSSVSSVFTRVAPVAASEAAPGSEFELVCDPAVGASGPDRGIFETGYRLTLHRERKEEQACEEPDQDTQRYEETTTAPECFLLLAALPPPTVGCWRLLRRLGSLHRRVDRPPHDVRAPG
jgi:hypothetical protein